MKRHILKTKRSPRRDWRTMLTDAHALLDEAEVRREPSRHDYVIVAARLIVDAESIAIPRDRVARAEWKRDVDIAERRIAVYGCAGCLAMETRPTSPPKRGWVTAYSWTLSSRESFPTDPASVALARAGDALHKLGLYVSLIANPDGSRELSVWARPDAPSATGRRKVTNPYYRRPPGWRPAAFTAALGKRVRRILLRTFKEAGVRLLSDDKHGHWTLHVRPCPVDVAVAEGRADYEAGRYKEFATAEDMLAYLDAGVAKDKARKARRRSAKQRRESLAKREQP